MPAVPFFAHPGRLEAFSDGVFAIAITLLVLEIRVPPAEEAATPARLWQALLHRWPSYFAFLLSFFTIFVAWIGHHHLMQRAKTVTAALVWANGLFLLVVTFLPFPTALVAQHLTHPSGAVAAAVYGVTTALSALAFFQLSLTLRRSDPELNEVFAAFSAKNAWIGVLGSALSVGLAFLSPVLALLLIGGVWAWWALPQFQPSTGTGPEDREPPEPGPPTGP